MTRRAWRYFMAAALVLALSAIALTFRRGGVTNLIEPSFLATRALPELLQRIRNFHRVITREGRKVLEVSASEASYFKNDKAIEIVDPKVIFYEGGDQVGEVSAARGKLYLADTEVQSVEVIGDVLFELGRMRVRTENLTYDKATIGDERQVAPRVEAAELDLVGTDMTVDMVNRSVVMSSNVSMVLKPHEETPS